jgi:TatD DNase family protein
VSGWVDAHTHLDLPAFDPDRDAVWARAAAAGVTGAVLCAADPAAWDNVVATAQHLGQPWTLGVHPWWCADLTPDAHDALFAALAARPTPHGVGETGLDHGRARTDAARALQDHSLRAHLRLARARDVPVVLHIVRAYEPAARILREEGLPAAGGLVHSWSGDPNLVPAFVALGLHLSFSAGLTRSPRVAEALRRTPADRLLLETDAPDQALTPGTRGEPADLVALAQAAAAIRGESPTALLDRCADNARRLFPGIGKSKTEETNHRDTEDTEANTE